MLNEESVKELNRILPELTIGKDFKISDYIVDKTNYGNEKEIEISMRIFLFLVNEKFAENKGSLITSRLKSTPEISWIYPKGIELKNAGSYDAYCNKESVQIVKKEVGEARIENKILYLTGILSFGTLILATSEAIKIYNDYCNSFGIFSVWGLIILIVILRITSANKKETN